MTSTNEHSYLMEYADAIKAGDIIAGRHVKDLLGMLQGDFANSAVRIDLSASAKRIKFIESECKLYEAPFAGKPFRLELFQKAIIESIFAPQVWSDEAGRHIRKYQDILICIARKAGKSPLTAAIILSELFCGEIGTKVLIGSNDYEQADIMYQACDAMREESRKLERVTRRTNKGIFFGNRKQKTRHGKFTAQNKGGIRKISARGTNKEGRNIKVGAVDEVHEMQDNRLIMPIRQALSTQDEPLYFEITTEGFVDGGYLDGRIADAERVLCGEIERPGFLPWLFMQDSEAEVWQDESSWQKSNPGLGTIKKRSFLRNMLEEARTSASTRAFVLCKDFNIKQNSAAAWLDAATIENPASFDMETLRGAYYIGGLDYAETTDLCAAKALFVLPDGKKFIIGQYFIPEIKVAAPLDDLNPRNPEHKDYRAWQEQGLVTICSGSENDAAMVANWFVSLYNDYGCRPYKIGYDNWHANDFKRLVSEFAGLEVLERVGMDKMSLTSPMRLLESDLKTKALNYGNNPIDRWCLSNISIKMDSVGMILPVKKYGQSKNRIDGGMAMMICYAAYQRYRSDYDALMRQWGGANR